MFTANLEHFKVHSAELRRQADHYRLVKAAAGTTSLSSRLSQAFGQLMVNLGQQLISDAQLSR